MKNTNKLCLLFTAVACITSQVSAMVKPGIKEQSEQVEHKIRADNAAASLSKQQAPSYSSRVLSVASMLVSPIRSGYNWVNGPDTTMPTLESLQVVTFSPILDPSTVDASKVLSSKEAIVGALKKPYRSELMAMFLPFLKQAKQPVNETILVNGQLYRVQDGIPADIKNHQNITIRSGGCYDPKAYSAYVGLKAGNTNGACVAFSFPTSTRRAFNYCQEQDIECINVIHDAVVKQNPKANITLYGTCKGGTNILRFLAEKSEQGKDLSAIKAAVMESPTISVKKAISQYPIYPFVGLIFPNHKSNGKTILDAKQMPKHVPIFIGRLKNDTVSKFGDNNELVQHLNKVGSKDKTYLLTTEEPSIIHGQLGRAKGYQAAVNAFYKVNGLPHRPLQSNAEVLLKQASEEASNVTH